MQVPLSLPPVMLLGASLEIISLPFRKLLLRVRASPALMHMRHFTACVVMIHATLLPVAACHSAGQSNEAHCVEFHKV